MSLAILCWPYTREHAPEGCGFPPEDRPLRLDSRLGVCYQNHMNIGPRLRELREAKGYSQGDIERRTGLLRCYISRVENGHSTPTLSTLEKWAEALGLEMYQLFITGDRSPIAPKTNIAHKRHPSEESLLKSFRALDHPERTLLLGLAKELQKPRRHPA
jgi:transcriptional regulator with XRE-family HTH domain